MRFVMYRPIHVALTRIISVTMRKNERYTPASGRRRTRSWLYFSNACVIPRARAA